MTGQTEDQFRLLKEVVFVFTTYYKHATNLV